MSVFDIMLASDSLFGRERTGQMEADAAHRRALATLCEAEDCLAFSARWHIMPLAAARARLKLNFEGRLVQTCVITLEPVETTLADSYTATLFRGCGPTPGKGPKEEPATRGETVDLSEEDHIYLENASSFDLGGLLDELILLAVDPYPRKPGAHLDPGGVTGVSVLVERAEPRPDTGSGSADDAPDRPKPFHSLGKLLDK